MTILTGGITGAITVCRNFITTLEISTLTLLYPKTMSYGPQETGSILRENFTPAVIKRIETAAISDTIIHVIDSTDYLEKTVFTPAATGTWKFAANNVTDFAFAVSNHYIWDASSVLVDSASGRRSVAEAAYNTSHPDYFDVASQAHQSVFFMSYYYPKVPFPFNHITVFDGTDQMEYPMMVNDNPTRSHKDAVQLTTHEIFHSYFPFYMGINETKYAWMDEGWATIGESVISPLMGEPEDEGIFSKTRYESVSGTDKDVPLITNTKLYSDDAYFSNSYGKGGLCYYVLQDMLGDELYFRSCISTWMTGTESTRSLMIFFTVLIIPAAKAWIGFGTNGSLGFLILICRLKKLKQQGVVQKLQ